VEGKKIEIARLTFAGEHSGTVTDEDEDYPIFIIN